MFVKSDKQCPASPFTPPAPVSASPDEAVSWGKIRRDAKPVKLCAEATLVLPLLVGETFAKNFEPKENTFKLARTE